MRNEKNLWTRRAAALGAAFAGALLLAGCSGMSVPGFGEGAEDAEQTPRMMLVPGETVCLMPNAKIGSEQLDNVLLLGMQAAGVSARLTREGEPAGACPKTVVYGLSIEEKKLKSIDFRLQEGERPLAQASGPADEKGEIPMKRVHAYMATFISRLYKTPVAASSASADEPNP